MHAGSLHWLCVANMSRNKKDNGTHYIFDSLARRSVREDINNQIANYACSSVTELVLHTESGQQQTNFVDCGLFAIAFATSLAYGEDPRKMYYDENLLRPHLVKCLTENKMSPFPTLKKKGQMQRCKQYMSRVELYCSCRMPYFPSTDERYDMACCDKYSGWYHRVCEKIPDSIFTNRKKRWTCLACL